MSDTTRTSLEAGRVVTAIVWPAGAQHRAPATLNWSFESGATVQLVELTDQWQIPFNSGHHVMHLAVNEGEEYTMLDARVTGLSADGRITAIGAFTLALGAHTDNLERWPVAKYSTANLTEWFSESGINVSYPDTDGVFIRLHYQTPPQREVSVDAGKLVFASEHDTPGVVYAADWSISTWQTMRAVPNEPSTLDELSRWFAHPLRSAHQLRL
jgi:hypothetical protein